MFEKTKNLVTNSTTAVDQLSNYKRWREKGYLKNTLQTFGVSAGLLSLNANAQVNVPDFDGTLTEVQASVFSVLDWLIVIVVSLLFVIGIVGLAVGLVRVFSGRAAEGVIALVVGFIAIVATVGLVSILVTRYNAVRG